LSGAGREGLGSLRVNPELGYPPPSPKVDDPEPLFGILKVRAEPKGYRVVLLGNRDPLVRVVGFLEPVDAPAYLPGGKTHDPGGNGEKGSAGREAC